MTSQAESYTVGWICAIPTEFVVACELLDEEYERDRIPRVDTQRDSNSYTFGRIHEHQIVIACLPKGRYGTTSAAAVAANMRWSFPAIRFGLFVGIAGGAPSHKHDIRLGDIVVSCPTPRHGGVLQYDFGKAIEDHNFVETGHLAPPPDVLLAALSKIEMGHIRQKPRILETIFGMLKRNENLRAQYGPPDPTFDKLYELSWFGQEREVVRQGRKFGASPVIHYGLIASANQLMKDRKARDALVAKHDVLCFEMEAAGLMNNFPCLVIRGICDYSDIHKNDDWQGYAAAAAAAYSKELLEIIPGKDVTQMRPIRESFSTEIPQVFDNDGRRIDTVLEGPTTHIKIPTQSHISVSQDSILSDELHRNGSQSPESSNQFETRKINGSDYMKQIRLPASVQPTNQIGVRLKDVNEESARWFIDSPEFRLWTSVKESAYVWLYGLPATGKTVTVTYTLQHLLKSRHGDPSSDIASIFCSQKDTEVGILWVLTSQLSARIDRCRIAADLAALPQFARKFTNIADLSSKLWDLMEVMICLLPQDEVILIVDGIDEIEGHDRARFLQSLEALKTKVRGRGILRALISSRDYPDVRDALRDFTSIERGKERKECLNTLHFEEWNAREMKITDVQKGGSWLTSDKHYKKWLASDGSDLLWIAGKPGSGKSTLTKLIVRQLTSQSFKRDLDESGSSNRLMLEDREIRADIISSFHYSFRGGITESSHELMLRSIAYQIFAQNEKLFAVIQGQYRALKSSGLHWSLDNLKAALCSLYNVQFKIKIFIIVDGMDESDNSLREDILDFLSGLSNSSGLCTLKVLIASRPESSIRPWMIRARHVFLEQKNRDDIRAIVVSKMWELEQFRQSTLDHQVTATELQEQRGVFAATEAYIVDNSQGVFLWVVLVLRELENMIRRGGYSFDDIDNSLRSLPTELGGLYAHMLARLVKQIDGSINLETRGRRILAWVTFANQQLSISELGDALAIPSDFKKYRNYEAFDIARARLNDLEQGLQSLCGGFIELQRTSSTSQEPPEILLQLMHQTVREFLLGRSHLAKPYDMNEIFGDTEIASTCCRSIYLAFIVSIAQTKADRNFPLAEELSKHLSRWRLLPYALSNLAFHLSHLSSQSTELRLECEGLIKQVLGRAGSYASLLLRQWVFSQAWFQHLDALADQQLSIACLNHVLIHATVTNNSHVTNIMLLLRADPTSALREAAQAGQTATVKILLNYGADVNAQDRFHSNALQAAAESGYDSIVEMLIDAKADVNAQGGDYGNALQAAAAGGHASTIKMLIDAGADVKAHGGFYGNALQAAAKGGYIPTVKVLIEAGVDVNAQGGEYGNALIAATWRGHDSIVKMLIEAGADVNAQGGWYGNAVQAAALREHDSIVERLIDAGANVTVA